MLTSAQRKRLAKEARKLAMECVEGQMPQLQWQTYCGCAAHEVAKRAGFDASSRAESWDGSAAEAVAEQIAEYQRFSPEDQGRYPANFIHLIDEATYFAVTQKDPDALVFPLLALADALEEA